MNWAEFISSESHSSSPLVPLGMCEGVQRGAAIERAEATQTSAARQSWIKIADGMGVTVGLQNLGDAQLCRDITAYLEQAFTERQGEWRVCIAGSRAAENWDLRVEGPNGFERSYTVSAAAGEHELLAIRTLVPKLVPPSKH